MLLAVTFFAVFVLPTTSQPPPCEPDYFVEDDGTVIVSFCEDWLGDGDFDELDPESADDIVYVDPDPFY